ncbi:hypothetical protein RN001_015379 [Aquatica leii]|uniref:Uncharacterized protein n=1 Tax=Aquatica leii TaxID=1421715 RepID=A0AAN7PZB5_9COLE|nr:hypothetical protein RN001_015379 [Aquatica leii]
MSNKNVEKVIFDNLQPYQNEFFQLTEITGLQISPQIMSILIRMLNINVPPEMVYQLLKCIRRSTTTSKYKRSSTSR